MAPDAGKTELVGSICNVGFVPVSIGQIAYAVLSIANKMETIMAPPFSLGNE